jgi:hypothetical protein
VIWVSDAWQDLGRYEVLDKVEKLCSPRVCYSQFVFELVRKVKRWGGMLNGKVLGITDHVRI